MHPEDLVEPGDREDSQRGAVVHDERDLPVGLVELLLSLDQDAQAARVDEPHVFEIHEDPAGTTQDELPELVSKRRGRVQIDLATDVQDRPVACGVCVQPEFDAASPPLAPRGGLVGPGGAASIGALVSATPSDAVTVVVPARAEHLHVLRTVAASVAARHRLSLDATEDLRIAVDEACAQLLRAGGTTITARMRGVADGIEVLCSSDARVGGWPPEESDRGLATQILRGLADTVAWETTEGGDPAIRIGKRAVGSTGT